MQPKPTNILSIQFANEISQQEIPLFRGAVIHSLENKSILFQSIQRTSIKFFHNTTNTRQIRTCIYEQTTSTPCQTPPREPQPTETRSPGSPFDLPSCQPGEAVCVVCLPGPVPPHSLPSSALTCSGGSFYRFVMFHLIPVT